MRRLGTAVVLAWSVVVAQAEAALPLEPLPGSPFTAPAAGRVPLIADFTGDGNADVLGTLTANANTSSLLFAGDGQGGLAAPVSTTVVGGPAVAANLTGSPAVDVVSYTAAGPVPVWENSGTGTFTSSPVYSGNTSDLAVADIDADGDNDIAAAYGAPFVTHVLRNTPIGWTDIGLLQPADCVELIDIDLDGDRDLVTALATAAADQPGTISVRANDGTGTFQAPVATVLPGTQDASVMTAGDLDGVNGPDLVVRGDDKVTVILNTPAHTLSAQAPITVGSTTNHANSLSLGDLDGDEDLDLAVASASPSLTILPGDGQGGFGAAETVAIDEPHSTAIGSFDGDEYADLVISTQNSPFKVALLRQATTQVTAPSTVTASESGASVTVTLTRGANPRSDSTVDFRTVAGGATDADYEPTSGTVSFTGDTAEIVVPLRGDTTDETDETFTIELEGHRGAVVDQGAVVVTLTDDDVPPASSATPDASPTVTATPGGSATPSPSVIPPPPPPTVTRTVGVRKRIGHKALRRKGLKVTLTCSAACSGTVSLRGKRRTFDLDTAGTTRLRIKAKVRRGRKATLQVRFDGVDAVTKRTVRVR